MGTGQPGPTPEEIPEVMWRRWINKCLNLVTPGPNPADAAQARVVPHHDWTAWLAQGQWDRAAVCLEEWRGRPPKPELAMLIPQWHEELVTAFLKNGRADLSPATALRWLRRVDRFADRGLCDSQLEAFRHLADLLWDFARLENQGLCREALARLDQATRLAQQQNAPLNLDEDGLRQRVNQAHETLMEWSVRMRIYTDDGRHDLATTYAGKILGLAPEHLGALAVLRLKDKTPTRPAAATGDISETVRIDKTPESPVQASSSHQEQSPATNPTSPVDHFWQVSLDRAGSWLLTTASTVRFSADSNTDVAKTLGLGPHACGIQLARDEEGCWLISADGDSLLINNKPTRSGCLMDGTTLTLAGGPELRFCQPRMETGSARLERTGKPSRQGLQGLVLVGDFLELGGPAAEVPHAELARPLVIINQSGQLMAKAVNAPPESGQAHALDEIIQPPHRMRLENVGIYWEFHRLA